MGNLLVYIFVFAFVSFAFSRLRSCLLSSPQIRIPKSRASFCPPFQSPPTPNDIKAVFIRPQSLHLPSPKKLKNHTKSQLSKPSRPLRRPSHIPPALNDFVAAFFLCTQLTFSLSPLENHTKSPNPKICDASIARLYYFLQIDRSRRFRSCTKREAVLGEKRVGGGPEE